MKQLAIVIPAYKIEFFRSTLESLATQTCKDFTVYIGDDGSNAPFRDLVNEYTDKIDVRYMRFEHNMGGKDLVAQWKRCIDLTEREPWLWLFSDDDMIQPNCVELFYRQLQNGDDYDVLHFNVKVIDSRDNVIRQMASYPDVLGSEELYRLKTSNKLDSFVVEYVFSRRVYDAVGGFCQYELAWNSDLATWIKMGKSHGIKTIDGAYVLWRQSEMNITPDHSNEIVFRKLNIDVDFISWTKDFFAGSPGISSHNKYALFRLITSYCQVLSRQQIRQVIDRAKAKGIVGDLYKCCVLFILPLLRFARKIKHNI